MKSHSSRFCVYLLAGTAFSLLAPSATGAIDRVADSGDSRQANEQVDLVQLLYGYLGTIMRLLGGDPDKIRSQALQSAIASVQDQFDRNGVSGGLTLPETLELYQALLSAYSFGVAPPPNAPQFDQDGFLTLIAAIWVDAGFPIEQLTQ